MRMRARLAAVVTTVALATTVSGMGAGAASAQTLDPLGSLQGTLAGVVGTLTGAVQAVVCPLASGTSAQTAACALDAIHIRYATAYKRPDGTILRRELGALLEVPTFLDVTGDGIPDVIATTSVLAAGLTGAHVNIVKIRNGGLPASIEAVVADPTGGLLPRANIAYGEDGLDGTIADIFTSTVRPRPGGRNVDVQVSLDNDIRSPGPSLGLLASLFDGTPTARANVVGGVVRYTDVPTASTATVSIGDAFSGQLAVNSPTRLDVDFAKNDGPAVQRFTGRIDRLPTTTSLAFDQPAPGQRALRFASSARIASVTGTYVAGVNGAGGLQESQHVEAAITDLPTKLSVRQTGDRSAALSTQGTGPIGGIRFGIASGTALRTLTTSDAYFRMFEDAGGRSLAGAVKGLTEATVDASDAIDADTQFTGVPDNAVRVLVDSPERHLDAHFSAVPDHMTVHVDPHAGQVHYDGHGQAIHAIDLDATQTSPFFERASHITGAIRDLPATVDLGFGPQAGDAGTRAAFTASAPIGSVELTATDGAPELPADGHDGVIYRDTDSRYALGARISGLQSATLTPTAKGYDVHTETKGGLFTAVYETKAQTLGATIDELPSRIDLGLDIADGHYTYTGAGPIDRITATATRQAPWFARATHLEASLDGIPSSMTVDVVKGDGSLDATATGAPQSIAVTASNAGQPGVPAGTAGAAYVDGDDDFIVGVRVNGLQHVHFDGGATYHAVVDMAPGDFGLRYDDGDSTLDGLITQLPGHLDATIDTATGTYRLLAPGGIPKVSATYAKRSGPLAGRITKARATLSGIAEDQTVQVGTSNGVTATATPALPSLDVAMSSDGTLVDVPGTDPGATFTVTPAVQRAALRITGLQTVGVTKAHDRIGPLGTIHVPLTIHVKTTTPQRFSLGGTYDDAGDALPAGTLSGVIDAIPSEVSVSVPSDRIHIDGHGSGIDHITLGATNLPVGPFRNAKVDIDGVSPVLDVYTGADPATLGAGGSGGVLDPGVAAAVSDATTTSTGAVARIACPQDDPDCLPGDDPCDLDPTDCPDPDPNPCPCPQPPPPAPVLYGIDAHGHGIDLITVHAWTDDADLVKNSDLTSGGNQILFDDKRAGHEDLRARIVHLQKATYTKNAVGTGPHGYPVFNGEDTVDVRFTQAQPLTLGIKHDGIGGTVKIPEVSGRTLPTRYGLQIGTKRVIHAIFTPDVTIPQVDVDLAAGNDVDGERKALVRTTLSNVPTSTEVCIAQDGFPDCGAADAPGGDTTKVLGWNIDFHLNSNGPPVGQPGALTVTGRVCLGRIGSNAWVPAACLSDDTAKTYVDIQGLQARNVHLQYVDHGVTDKYQGNFGSDPGIAVFLNTDGILVDRFRYIDTPKPDDPSDEHGDGVEFVKTDQPLTAAGFFAAANLSTSVRVGWLASGGSLSCPPTTHLFLLDRDAEGNVSHTSIPFFDDDLWTKVDDLGIDC